MIPLLMFSDVPLIYLMSSVRGVVVGVSSSTPEMVVSVWLACYASLISMLYELTPVTAITPGFYISSSQLAQQNTEENYFHRIIAASYQ